MSEGCREVEAGRDALRDVRETATDYILERIQDAVHLHDPEEPFTLIG